jgi:hypothetical protein
MAKHTITEKFIAARVAEAHQVKGTPKARNRVFYDDHKDAPTGFGVCITKAGAASFVLNYYATGAERRATIGKFGPAPALSITAARKDAAKVRTKVQAGADPVDDARAAKRAKLAALEAAKAVAEAKRARDQHTLAALVAAYIADLTRQGRPKRTARDYETLFERAVAVPFPKIAALPLDEVTTDAVLPAFHRLQKGGAVRDPEKLAACLRAAFNAAMGISSDSRQLAYSEFKVTANPLANLKVSRPKVTPAEARDKKAEKYWTLTQQELAAYWARIEAQEDANGAMLRLHLLTGGQRREQLVRITRADYDEAAHIITLWDGKGRRSTPREHRLPLLPEAEAALLAMAGDRGEHLVTLDKGRKAASVTMLDHACGRVADAMLKAGEVRRAVTPGTIRRTIETMLGQAGVFKEIRAQLQSHGINGVQDRHYDMGDYLEYKREALEKLRALCNPKPDNVTQLRRKA